MKEKIYLGKNEAFFPKKEVKGEMVSKNGEDFYRISNVDAMRPFFMSVVSHSNHWMFISSNGGLTAGRKDSDQALFPYYTDDKITESAEITGSKTIILVKREDGYNLWEPFSGTYKGVYNLNRNLYKNSLGNKVIFEEINHDLNLTFTYEWNNSNTYGFVKKSSLKNDGDFPVKVRILDGIQNLIPFGLASDLQNTRSNLADAYKKCEFEKDAGIGLYTLSSIIIDRAEPSEALKATLAWSYGFKNPTYLISSLQLDEFRMGGTLKTELDIKAEKGAYFVQADFKLSTESEKNWMIVADVNQSVSQLQRLSKELQQGKEIARLVEKDIEMGSDQLIALTAAADGLQKSEDKLLNTRHFANTLFNIMRGGIFDRNYQIEKDDFIRYIANANKKVFKRNQTLLENLPEEFNLSYLKELLANEKDLDLKRLCIEYMPLKFSRRHGDPSRPWNKFSINTQNENDGSKILDYEGNWRDIFQNWEALSHAYPEFIESMIHKFLNATTFDGYNPYRVTKGGIDWEVIEPDDPWSFIGYWGDHQIIYLLKFLEFIEDYYPGKLANSIHEELFVYANVPYKIKTYEEILKNPKDTIDFDKELNDRIDQKRAELGADGVLLRDRNFLIYKVNLIEKLLATVLAKISNFIPEGGIWMNTQRPEWNDANNALVGNGVSMVTLYYLKRFMTFFERLITDLDFKNIQISEELVDYFDEVVRTFSTNKKLLKTGFSDADRKKILDGLGNAASTFRSKIYRNDFSSIKRGVFKTDLLSFFNLTHAYIDQSIDSNKRNDKMYHAYNLMNTEDQEEISISRLQEMLEGQVAVLSSGYLDAKEALDVLDALKKSALFRKDQNSYLLYPDKQLARFSQKNNIEKQSVNRSTLLKKLLKDKNHQIIEEDINGDYHFNGSFHNINSLKEALLTLSQNTDYQILIENERDLLLEIFEEVFNHKSFTGRSGTFFGYEGLGSIYWHMVSKLLLAVQENCNRALRNQVDPEITSRLQDHFYEIKEGIGVHKSPEIYGAFPTDPYSHTPASKGAQQPGMTGQVKEDLLSRIDEIGVKVHGGLISFKPVLLRREEFLSEASTFNYYATDGREKSLALDANSVAFTYCQVPVVYVIGDKKSLQVIYKTGDISEFKGHTLNDKVSKEIFERTDVIEKIEVILRK